MTDPIKDTYTKHVNDAKYKAKDYSLIPEFRISEHMEYYVDTKGGNFLADNESMFTIHGAEYASSNNENFVKTYSNSDFFKDYAKLRDEHKDLATATKIELKASAIMKFVPYEGFYPAERTLQLTQLFSQSYGPNMVLTGTQPSARPINQALFAPGILYNSIKSGIAVSHPTLIEDPSLSLDHLVLYDTYGDFSVLPSLSGTSPYPENGNVAMATTVPAFGYTFGGNWLGVYNLNTKIPFETILEPQTYLTDPIFDLESHPSGVLDATSSLGPSSPLYTMAMHNFLGSNTDFFNKDSNLTSIVSAHDKDNNYFKMQLNKRYKMRLYLRGCEEYNIDNIITAASDTISVNHLGISSSYINAMVAMSLTASTEFTRPTFSMYDRPYYDTASMPLETSTFVRDSNSYKHGGSAFGPPLIGSQAVAFVNNVTSYQLGAYGTVGYEAYTPPYYEGFSFAEFDFKPYDESGNETDTDTRFRRFTLDEIFSNLTSSYYRYSTTPIIDYFKTYFVESNIGDKNVNNLPRDEVQVYTTLSSSNVLITPSRCVTMQKYVHVGLNDSINDKTALRNKKVTYNEDGAVLDVQDDPTFGTRWVIQTKFESPIFDYTNSCTSSLPSTGSQNIGRGVWHNYGADLESNKGLFLQITDAPKTFLSGTTKTLVGGAANDVLNLSPTLKPASTLTSSLADVLGFPKTPARIGDIGNRKTISEAIVAIPFIDTHNRRRFFKLSEDLIHLAKTGDSFNVNGKTISAGQSVKKTIDAMKKYVIPPKFDFLTYDGQGGKPKVDPIVMYFFEFDYEFDREDIKRVWHNIQPKEQIKEASVTISHELLENELMDSFHDKLRWMVFKVKQKAVWNYYEKTLDSADDSRFKFKFNVNDQLATPDYSYNWPYDFMSLIEFGKIEANISLETEEEADRRRNFLKPRKVTRPKIESGITSTDFIDRMSNTRTASSLPFNLQDNVEDPIIDSLVSRATVARAPGTPVIKKLKLKDT